MFVKSNPTLPFLFTFFSKAKYMLSGPRNLGNTYVLYTLKKDVSILEIMLYKIRHKWWFRGYKDLLLSAHPWLESHKAQGKVQKVRKKTMDLSKELHSF